MAKLEDMYHDYLGGMSLADVGTKYDMHRQNVYDAFRRRGWSRRTKREAERLRSISSLEQRFNRFVDKRGADECWEWKGTRWTQTGYGIISVDGKRRGAHRVALEIRGVKIPDGNQVCHRCDNPPCVNPAHLYVGTPSDNWRDFTKRGDLSRLPKGEARSNARLTDESVRFVRSACRNVPHGMRMATYKRLADKLGVGTTTVQGAVNRSNWRHVK